MTLKENSQGGDVGTHQINSQRKDPRTLRSTSKKVADSEKAERKEVEKEEEEKEKIVKHGRSLWWTKRKEQFTSLFVSERKEDDVKDKGKKMHTEYTPVACITNTTVITQAQITKMLVAQDVMSCNIFVRNVSDEPFFESSWLVWFFRIS